MNLEFLHKFSFKIFASTFLAEFCLKFKETLVEIFELKNEFLKEKTPECEVH